jgi:hypothetical protein
LIHRGRQRFRLVFAMRLSLAATFEGEFSDVARSGNGMARYRWRERRGPGFKQKCRALPVRDR